MATTTTPPLAPDAIRGERDEYGHGTAEAANVLACAPDVDLVGIKRGGNATLAFKTASDLPPAAMTNSWGCDLVDPQTGPPLAALPNFLKPLEAAPMPTTPWPAATFSWRPPATPAVSAA
jgi:hypothetical protein